MNTFQDFLNKKFKEKTNKRFKPWLLERFINDLTTDDKENRLTIAQVEEAKTLLEIFERD